MGKRSGLADLPLHGGHVPAWLGSRMARLGRVFVEALVLEYGRAELLRRLSHPFWFQALGAVMGMDWHSSGITTSVVGALKRGLEPVRWELGVHVCGGRGRHSRNTPAELGVVAERTGLDGAKLARASRLVAKVDSAAVQDGFDLYLHAFVVTGDGDWTVVQQGMNVTTRQARRYHWLSEGLESFVDDPHTAVDGPSRGTIANLADRRAGRSRQAQLSLVAEGPDRTLEVARRAGLLAEGRDGSARALAPSPAQRVLPFAHLSLPSRHEVLAEDVVTRRLRATLRAAAERGPVDFPELLLIPGVGARTVRALAAVAEVLHGAPYRFSDPARFSLAHGGKDGHPFPVPLAVYDQTLGVMKRAVEQAHLGNDEKLSALRRLDARARDLDRANLPGPTFEEVVQEERRRAPEYGGRTVAGPA